MIIDYSKKNMIDFLSTHKYHMIAGKILSKDFFTDKEISKIKADQMRNIEEDFDGVGLNSYISSINTTFISKNKDQIYVIVSLIIDGYKTLFNKNIKDPRELTYGQLKRLIDATVKSVEYLDNIRWEFLKAFDQQEISSCRKSIIRDSQIMISALMHSTRHTEFKIDSQYGKYQDFLNFAIENFLNLNDLINKV